MSNIFREDSPRKQAIHPLRPRSSSRDVKNLSPSKQLSTSFIKDKKAFLMEENDKLKDEIMKLVENSCKNTRGKERDQKIKVLMQNFIIEKLCLKIQMNKKYIEEYKIKSSKYQLLIEALLSIQKINKELIQAFPQALLNQRQITQQLGVKIQDRLHKNQK